MKDYQPAKKKYCLNWQVLKIQKLSQFSTMLYNFVTDIFIRIIELIYSSNNSRVTK